MVFEAFRKRQKEALVVLTLLAMFAFVLGQALDNLINRGSRGADPVEAVAWGKKIKASQLARMQADRFHANQFFRRARMWVGLQPFDPFPTDRTACINAIVLIGKAQRLGLSVTDQQVTDLIHDFTENKLSQTDFFQVLSGAGKQGESERAGIPMTDRELYRVLGQELLISRVLDAIAPRVILDTPWDVYQETSAFKDMIQLEVARIPVANYVSKEGEPDKAVLQELFRRYKDRPANPERGEIGFLKPARIQASYVMARVDKFQDDVTVTDAEVEKYYEANKDRYRAPEGGVSPDRRLPGPPSEDVPLPPGLPKMSSPAPKAAVKEATKPAPEKGSAPKPQSPKSTPQKPDAKEKKTSWLPGLQPFLSATAASGILLADEKQAASSAPAKPAEKPAAPAKPAEKAVEKPADKATEKTAEKPAEKGVQRSAGKPSVEAATKPAVGAAPTMPPVKYLPLSQVKPEIVDILRRQKATDKAVAYLQKLNRDVLNPYLDRYAAARGEYLAQKRQSGDSLDMSGFTPPPPPDVRKVADAAKTTFGETGWITKESAAKLPGLGTAELYGQASLGDVENQFPALAFRSESDLYRARVLKSADGSSVYLVWLTAGEKASVPSFDEVKADVLAAWRLEQAAPKAKEAAEKFAEQVRKASGDMAKVFKDAKVPVLTTRLFPRVTGQKMPFGRELFPIPTVLEEIPNAGADLMAGVFEMKPGEVKVFPDAIGQNYYVIRVKERVDYSFAKFIGEYEIEMNYQRNPRAMATRRELQNQMRQAMMIVEREAGLEILRPERESESPLDS